MLHKLSSYPWDSSRLMGKQSSDKWLHLPKWVKILLIRASFLPERGRPCAVRYDFNSITVMSFSCKWQHRFFFRTCRIFGRTMRFKTQQIDQKWIVLAVMLACNVQRLQFRYISCWILLRMPFLIGICRKQVVSKCIGISHWKFIRRILFANRLLDCHNITFQ